jgi:cell division protein FtsI/penicillin-binding protein 2
MNPLQRNLQRSHSLIAHTISRCISLLVLLLLIAGCSQPTPPATASPTVVLPTATLPPPGAYTTQAPDAEEAARVFLAAWKAEDYSAMYAMLTAVSQEAIGEEAFTQRYRSIANESALSGLDTQILSSLTQTRGAQVAYRVILHSALVGDIQRETSMNLSLEGGQWRVKWDDTLILPELAGGNQLMMEYRIPSRANIYDRSGHALVAQTDATAIGLFPDQIDPEQEDKLLATVSGLVGLRPETIAAMYENFPPGAGWYLPLREVPVEAIQSRIGALSNLAGLVMQPFRARFYFDGGIAPHVVGYVSAIQVDEVDEYKRKGYQIDERVGRIGLEWWGEKYLSGQRGGVLYIVSPEGKIVTRLAETTPAPAQAITTTLDRDLQLGAQQAIAGFKGAVIVMERDTGRILALASSPGFDPNLFEPTNFNRSFQINDLFDQNNLPLLNRATLGQYPLGSVFKIITMAAALESGLYTADSTYECGYHFTELGGVTLHDWTWDHFQQDNRTMPSGTLTLPEGLMRSCNPFFYHIGLDLFSRGMVTAVSDMARAFGLGQLTGIEQIPEEDGQVPDPGSQLDATNLATGQGALQVTPLQVVDFIAAIGNGGILYRPQVVERVAPPDGEPTMTFKVEERGRLPISPENLKLIQDAMLNVVENKRGTAFHRFTGVNINVAGKTGTAQDPPRQPHAWFAGYTFEERPNKPDVAIVVVVENIGEGSDYAAPIFRRVLEIYFSGGPRTLYWWESGFGVPREQESDQGSEATPAP